ncbi:U6 snRNA phosphodiesterase isoform X2 [Electrophorus electricus]|uniref:U6 snRNA phosphodiesterase n=2 Tax=Electrophorus electricus TaxID=8005 RepID=A0AAY5ELI6_ELEEL|nr:U6 snRNA phosphodiesterase isoform X2 [Electrophorus electricus]XP_035388290.1 U6 snRNA phosphodiesterase isoform X2 [Electrophorus electricus]XP_035388291.1 U6 snRNA phosphodiesterase isoform X2 [Electrophorus electricus]XP_035388292.1 U6 snRNA phosphodiesterase isoform X2 [Electrophorus electricus]
MLVNYSSSSSDEENEVVNRKRQKLNPDVKDASAPRKREFTTHDSESRVTTGAVGHQGDPRKVLPLPARVLEMFGDSEEEHVDDCSQHGGRLRAFEHERGNWATYIYLPYEPEDVFLELLDELLSGAAGHGVALVRADEFHISLSKTVVLHHHWIQPFVRSLRTGLAPCRRFVCSADKLKVYSNHEKTRTFLGMEVYAGHSQLLEVMRRINETMEEFSLCTFYKNPSFHVSLAWCVGDFTAKLQDACLSELQRLVDSHEAGPFQIRLNCRELRCKTGNKVFLFPLQ